MIALFTDYGSSDPYCGLLKAAILETSQDAQLVDLLHHAPDFNLCASAHLLAGLLQTLPPGVVCLAVVDPGVGSSRDAVVMQADNKWFVGPDNGLLSVVAARASSVELWRIDWRPEKLSVSFHGRDLFAPVAAWIDQGVFPHDKLSAISCLNTYFTEEDLLEIIYIDHYGNAMTGIRSEAVTVKTVFKFRSKLLEYARVFSEAQPGTPFWYVNSLGLIEFAMNCASVAVYTGAKIGDQVEIFSVS